MDPKLHQKIEDFIAEKRESDGGYAPVIERDMELLEEIIEGLVEAKFERDPDGDLPVEWNLINRHTHLRMHYRPLRYDHKIEGWGEKDPMSREERVKASLELHHAVTLNFNIATTELERYHNHIERRLRDEKEAADE